MQINRENIKKINEWLSWFDPLPVECDGMTRLISAALTAQRIEHTVHHGYLSNKEDGRILHYWIEINDNHIIDLRARMWLGDSAPHGLFENKGLDVHYDDHGELSNFNASPFIFMILSGRDINDVPALSLNPVVETRQSRDPGEIAP